MTAALAAAAAKHKARRKVEVEGLLGAALTEEVSRHVVVDISIKTWKAFELHDLDLDDMRAMGLMKLQAGVYMEGLDETMGVKVVRI